MSVAPGAGLSAPFVGDAVPVSTVDTELAVSPKGDAATPVCRVMQTATGVLAAWTTLNVPDSLPVATVVNTEHDMSVKTFALASLLVQPAGVFHASGLELTAHRIRASPAAMPDGYGHAIVEPPLVNGDNGNEPTDPNVIAISPGHLSR